MDDQTDLFAQLTRLHAQGLLTDAEFEAKKDALRNRSPNSSETVGEVDQHANSGRPSNKARLAYAATLGIAVIGFVGLLASQTGKPGGGSTAGSANEGDNTDAAGLPVSPAGAGWTTTTGRDPMTDVSYRQAAIKLAGQQADATIQVSCSSTGALSYIITTFDKSGETTPMRLNAVGARVVNDSVAGSSQVNPSRWQQGYSFINYEIRAGSAPAVQRTQYNPRYDNQIEIQGLPARDLLHSLATADTATLRVQMPYGDEAYQWSQSSQSFRQTVETCPAVPPTPPSDPAKWVLKDGKWVIQDGQPLKPTGFTSEQKRALKTVEDLEAQCRGGSGDDPATEKACTARDSATSRMIATGVCWGKEDQVEAEYIYHLCERGSIGFADSPQGRGAR